MTEQKCLPNELLVNPAEAAEIPPSEEGGGEKGAGGEDVTADAGRAFGDEPADLFATEKIPTPRTSSASCSLPSPQLASCGLAGLRSSPRN